MGTDLLVNLYELPPEETTSSDIRYLRLLSPNIHQLEDFILAHFSKGWVSEIKVGCYQVNPTVFIAVKGEKIVGFAGYDCTAKGFFGPTGVDPKHQGHGIGKNLLLKTLHAMKESGYAYAIIGGGKGKAGFYQKCANATLIKSKESIYSRMIK